jgi:hypothetical protein
MSQIHIVFQVLNFIFSADSSPYSLSADEEKMLILLARHRGPKGIYPSIPTLAKETKRDSRNVKRTLDRLNDKSLITIEHHPGKSSSYFLHIPSQKLYTTPGVDATPDVYATPGVNAPSPLASTPDTPGVNAPLYNLNNQSKRNNTERARAPLAPPSIFEPDEESIQLSKELSISLKDELDKYRATKKKPQQNQYTFRAWLKEGHLYNQRISKQIKQEVRSTVQEWGPGHPGWESIHRTAQ